MNQKLKALVLSAIVALSVFTVPLNAKAATSAKAPARVNVHVGADASTEANLTWITGVSTNGQVKLAPANGENYKIYTGTSEAVQHYNEYSKAAGFSQPETIYSNQVEFKGLKPNTKYNYVIGEGEETFEGTFTTAPKAGTRKPTTFVYVSDPQIAETGKRDSEAWGAATAQIGKLKKVDFMYIAGDHTDRDGLDFQWEKFYNNIGAYPTAPQDLLAKTPLVSVYGNHDTANDTLDKNVNLPDEYGRGVYSFDWGTARYIMLNLEAGKDPVERERQYEIARTLIIEAKEAGLWTILGWHKSFYTGASHVDDGDVIEGRKFWGPRLAALDADVILQGHDHVYSRGFIDASGYKVDASTDAEGQYILPDNAPLWMVGNHPGGLKWYEAVNYDITPGDPIAPDYEFLDVNSTDDESNVKQEQTYTVVKVYDNRIEFTAYMFKYDVDSDTIVTEPYIYDQFTVTRTHADRIGTNNAYLN